MKKHILSFIAILFFAINANAQVDLIKAIGNVQGVTAVNISKEMLALIPKQALADDNKEIAALYDKIENIQTLMAEDDEIGTKLLSNVATKLQTAKYQFVQKRNDDGTMANIYYRSFPEKQTSVVFAYKNEGKGTIVVMMNGIFTIEDLVELGIEGLK